LVSKKVCNPETRILSQGVLSSFLILVLAFGVNTITVFGQAAQTNTYENDEFGFSLQHPSDWEEIEPSSAEIQLIGSVPYIIKFQ
jgi:hypothetical protein